MKLTEKFIVFALCFFIMQLTGCRWFIVEEPYPISGELPIPRTRQLTDAEKAHCDSLSDESAKLAWSVYGRNDFIQAMWRFNMAWELNPNNYQAYWGFGLIQGKRASKSKNPDFSRKYFKQSVRFLTKALELAPNEKKNFIKLDLANALIGSGAIELHFSKQLKAKKHLRKAIELLQQVVKVDMGNARAYYLLSTSHAFLGKINTKDLELAREYALKAEVFGYKISETYKKDIGIPVGVGE